MIFCMPPFVLDRSRLVEQESCIFCSSPLELTDEHIFPASLGGEDVISKGSCSACNHAFSARFEAAYNNGFKPLCYLLRIGNRERKVPSIKAATVIDGTKLDLVLEANGNFEFQEKKEERLTDTGEKAAHYLLFSEKSKQRLRDRAERRGETLEGIEGDGRPITFEPESFMPLDFIGADCAIRSVTKIALMAVAKVGG